MLRGTLCLEFLVYLGVVDNIRTHGWGVDFLFSTGVLPQLTSSQVPPLNNTSFRTRESVISAQRGDILCVLCWARAAMRRIKIS